MWERLPFAGALQRAAQRTYSGIVGHMAMPDSAEEHAVIAEVAESGQYETGHALKQHFDRFWVPVVASGKIGKSSPTLFNGLGRVCVLIRMCFGDQARLPNPYFAFIPICYSWVGWLCLSLIVQASPRVCSNTIHIILLVS
jgi:hypothetical protein